MTRNLRSMNKDNWNHFSKSEKISFFYFAFRKTHLTIDHSKYLDETITKYIKTYIIVASLAVLIFSSTSLYLWDSLFSVLMLLVVSIIWLFLLFKKLIIKYLFFLALFYLSSKFFNLEDKLSDVLLFIFAAYSIFTWIILSFTTHSKIYTNQHLFNDLFESWQISIRYKGKKYTYADTEVLFTLMNENEEIS